MHRISEWSGCFGYWTGFDFVQKFRFELRSKKTSKPASLLVFRVSPSSVCQSPQTDGRDLMHSVTVKHRPGHHLTMVRCFVFSRYQHWSTWMDPLQNINCCSKSVVFLHGRKKDDSRESDSAGARELIFNLSSVTSLESHCLSRRCRWSVMVTADLVV